MDVRAFNQQISAWNACGEARDAARKGSKAERRIAAAQDGLYRAQHCLEEGDRSRAVLLAIGASHDLMGARECTTSLVVRVAITQASDATRSYIRTLQA